MPRAHHTAMDVDPRLLVMNKQVRGDAAADKALVESIRRRGILQPIVVTEPEPETFVVLAGHRRTLAALEVGLRSVPITIVNDEGEAARIVDQLAENDHRTALSALDRAAAFEQLALLGLPAAAIAKETASSKSEVEQGLRVAKSEVVRELAPQFDATLDQLAALAEFEDDPETLEMLSRMLREGRDFTHALAGERHRRADDRMVAERVAELEAEGIPAVDARSFRFEQPSSDVVFVHQLKGCPEDCEGRAVGVMIATAWEDGERSATLEEEPVCSLWREKGHRHKWEPMTRSAEERAKDEEERAKADAERRQRLEAHTVATEVRAQWLRDTLSGKVPDGALVTAVQMLAMSLGLDTVPLLDVEVSKVRTRSAALQALVALTFFAVSSFVEPTTFGPPRPSDVATRYLRGLEALGYELSEAERELLVDEAEQAAREREETRGGDAA